MSPTGWKDAPAPHQLNGKTARGDTEKTLAPWAAAAMLAAVNPLVLLAPVFFSFELWQLVVGERYLGIRHIKAGVDPRELPMGERMAAIWTGGLIVYWLWMASLLLHPVGRAQGVVLLAVSVLGYALRAATGLKWTLVILTFEGSIRIGMLISLVGMSWRALSRL